MVFWDPLVRQSRDNDPPTADAVLHEAGRWREQVVRIGDATPVRLGGYGYSIGRSRLLEIDDAPPTPAGSGSSRSTGTSPPDRCGTPTR